MKVYDILTEGPMDYFKGFSREASNKIRNVAQPFKDMHQSGQKSSMEADVMKKVVQLATTIQKYRALKKQVAPIKEGVMDYVRGASRELGNKASQAIQPIRDIHQAGKQSSAQADIKQLEQSAKQQLSDLVRLLNRYGPESYPFVKQAFGKYNIPPGIRAAVINKLKGLVDTTGTQQPTSTPNQSYDGPGIQARYQKQ